jgi:RHS repeat-associated protein
MEAGERWMLNDVAGKPIYVWDSRNHQFHTAYDQLRRPVETSLREGAGSERLIGRTVYGETRPNPEANNLRGKVVQVFDQAGVVTTDEYDFKGNLLRSQRQLAELVDPQGTRIPAYKTTVNWSDAVQLDVDIYTSRTRYDALNRPTELTTPHTPAMQPSVIRPSYNEANLLEKMDVNLRGAAVATPFVTDIDYNAKGQRTLIDYGNGARTTYEYDPLTFRLTHLKTTRLTDQARLQDLKYTYDPAGNITQIEDAAQQTIYFNNQVVTPSNDYSYDAVYRLIQAEGREHIGQASQPQTTWDDQFRVHLPHPGDGQAMRRYTEQYQYDAVGNFEQLIHQAANGNWTRGHAYNEPSLIEPNKKNNRLSSTTVGMNNPEPYTHDAHGNMTSMPHLTLMEWDFQDQLQATARQVVNEGTPETTYYVYDAAGQRVRKVTERQNGSRKNERTYLGGFEVYREYGGDGAGVSLERESLHVMDDQQRIALVETRTDTPVPEQLIRYQFGNHLGSASLELDDAGQIISYEEYHPYGSTSYQAGRSAAEVSLKRYRYTGKERDEETGFSYHGARYYAPWLGRWVSADPAELMGGVAVYEYSRNNPIRFIDRDGRQPRRYTEDQPEEDPWNRAIIINALQEEVNQAQRGTRKYRYASERLETFKEMGWDPGPRVNMEGAPAPVNISAHYASVFIVPTAAAFHSLRFATFLTAVSAGEAITGRSFGALNPIRLLSGNEADLMIGRKLSVAERALAGVGAAIGLGATAWSKWSSGTPPSAPTPAPAPPSAPTPTPVIPQVTPPYTPNPNIRPHGQQPSPRPPGMQSHHPEQQTALSNNIANYNPNQDPALLMPTPQHRLTFGPQTAQRARGMAFAAELGTPQALGQAAVIMVRAGQSAATAGQVVLEHVGYLFGITPLANVLRSLP